jgi:hypothetical protein
MDGCIKITRNVHARKYAWIRDFDSCLNITADVPDFSQVSTCPSVILIVKLVMIGQIFRL